MEELEIKDNSEDIEDTIEILDEELKKPKKVNGFISFWISFGEGIIYLWEMFVGLF